MHLQDLTNLSDRILLSTIITCVEWQSIDPCSTKGDCIDPHLFKLNGWFSKVNVKAGQEANVEARVSCEVCHIDLLWSVTKGGLRSIDVHFAASNRVKGVPPIDFHFIVFLSLPRQNAAKTIKSKCCVVEVLPFAINYVCNQVDIIVGGHLGE